MTRLADKRTAEACCAASAQVVFLNSVSVSVLPIVLMSKLRKYSSDFVLFRRHLESHTEFSGWVARHLRPRSPLHSDVFVDVVTRLNALYVLFETPQQNLDTDPAAGEAEQLRAVEEKVVRHVAKVLLTPQQYEVLTSTMRHRF